SQIQMSAVFEDRTSYAAGLKVYGGSVVVEKIGLGVKGESSVTVLVSLNPVDEPFGGFHTEFPDTVCYESLLKAHTELHSGLMDRVSFSLSSTDIEEQTNERILLDTHREQMRPKLVEKLFNYGRYLLVSSSMGEAMYPANLQGLWNGDYQPAWTGGIFNNENVQMNYWASLAGNLHEALLPLFGLFESLRENFRENARNLFGCRGFLIPLYMSPRSGRKHDRQSHVVHWTAGGGWIAQHFFDYYLYTDDEYFLRQRAVPFMQEVALFYEDFFTEGTDGLWVSAPSNSPENCPMGDFLGAGKVSVCMNATMDFAVAKELFTNLIYASVHLGINGEHLSRWSAFLKKIPPYQINGEGALAEWMDPQLRDNYRHRHMSHLYGLFPGREISKKQTPELFNACRVAVENRRKIGIGQQTGWSLANMALIYARLGEGDRALECIRLLTRSCLGKNFFTYHNSDLSMGITQELIQGMPAPFQIDANFGLTAAVLEMLLFCRLGEIHLLPALPASWRKGSVQGLHAMGNVRVDLKWQNGKVEATMDSSQKQEVCIYCGDEYQYAVLPCNQAVTLSFSYKKKERL
ncbi:MAG: glycoside hydrolase family 95-like protein, partial [Kiritimatiellales bacterium]